VRWVQTDITAPDATDLIGLGQRYSLVLDGGCVHGLTDSQRQRAAAIDALTDPGATMLVFAFQPGRRGPAPAAWTATSSSSASRAGR
jgi:hypothetical protein